MDRSLYDDPALHTPPPVPSIHGFQQTIDRPRRTRAKFTVEEREKVLGVRRQGACLRCRILKIQCSLENPCQPCLQSAVKGSERKVLSFCYCVRTRFTDVNIFDSHSQPGGAANMQTETLMRMMGDLLARIATPACFSLASDPAVFNRTMVSWLTDPDFHLPNGSIVGLCCSSLLGLQFQDENVGVVADFRRFLLATSLAHSDWRGDKSIAARDICAAGQISGCRLLKRLDRVLTPQFLARCGRESCQVLFLLVLGAVLGVGYSSSQLDGHSPSFPSEMLSPEFQQSPTLWLAMKEHLCQMLAHHLVYVGSMLGIKLDTALEQRIIDTAVSRWNKAESFVWADAVDGSPGLESVESGARTENERIDQRPPWSHPPRFPHAPPKLVPIPCPDVAQFQPRNIDQWSENPQSYLSMEEPDILDRSQEEVRPPRIHSDSEARYRHSSEHKRRSIWIVRPYHAGPDYGLINLHARIRGGTGTEGLRAFV